MSQKQTRKFIISILLVALSLFVLERLYNNSEAFNVSGKDALYYDIVDVGMVTKEKLKDFEYMYGIIEKNYPFFEVNERLHSINWLKNKGKYKRLIKNTKSDTEFYLALEKILNDLHNPNTMVLNGHTFKHFYKVNYPNWSDALGDPRVMYRHNFNGDVNSIELDKEPVLNTSILIDNKVAYMKVKSMSYYHFEDDTIKIKDFLNKVENYEKLIIDIRGNAGGLDDYWQNIMGLITDRPLSFEYYSFFKDGYRNRLDTYKVENALNIRELDENIAKNIPEEVLRDFTFYKINPIQVDPIDSVNFKGKVYLLVDGDVVSSAEKFASFAKDTNFATLVGESTGGDRVFEEIPIFFLLQSKFAIRYNRELGLNSDGTINSEVGTTPHIQVDPTPHEDFNQDPCIQAVINDN